MAEGERFTCLRCGHGWMSRMEELPVLCPKCHSAYWDKPPRATGAGSRKPLPVGLPDAEVTA